MSTIFALAGFLLIILVASDSFITILSLRGGGPITGLLSRKLWAMLLAIHRRRAIHGILGAVGPAMLALVILVWYLALAVGWYLVFVSVEGSVIDNTTLEATNAVEKIYFTGTTLSDLGYGDLVPREFPWTILSGIAALSATLLTSAAISYILPVVSAGVQKRQLASSIRGLGADTRLMVEHMDPGGGHEMHQYVLSILSQLQSFTHQHMSYPVLLYFHSNVEPRALSLAILKFSDALFLMGHGIAPEQRPSKGFLHVAQGTLQDYVQLAGQKQVAGTPADKHADASQLNLKTLKELNLPCVEEYEFSGKLQQYLEFRQNLVRVCMEDGWLQRA